MRLKIKAVKRGPTPEDECIILQAVEAINLHEYALVDQTFHESGKLSNQHKHYYRLPNKQVNSGDLIKIFTGHGNSHSYANRIATRTYEYFAGLKRCVWDNPEDVIELVRITLEDSHVSG